VELVFEATSAALTVNVEVVFEPTALNPDILNFETPSSLTVVPLAPAGNEPVMISNVTFPADSGSKATTSKVVLPTAPFNTVPIEPDAVLKVGEASILI
jgi:hypothetical protein